MNKTDAATNGATQWENNFDERQRRLIQNCREYAGGDPAGMPGHNLSLIIAKFAFMMDTMEELIATVAKAPHSDAMAEKILAQPINEFVQSVACALAKQEDVAAMSLEEKAPQNSKPFTANEMREMTACIARGEVWIAKK